MSLNDYRPNKEKGQRVGIVDVSPSEQLSGNPAKWLAACIVSAILPKDISTAIARIEAEAPDMRFKLKEWKYIRKSKQDNYCLNLTAGLLLTLDLNPVDYTLYIAKESDIINYQDEMIEHLELKKWRTVKKEGDGRDFFTIGQHVNLANNQPIDQTLVRNSAYGFLYLATAISIDHNINATNFEGNNHKLKSTYLTDKLPGNPNKSLQFLNGLLLNYGAALDLLYGTWQDDTEAIILSDNIAGLFNRAYNEDCPVSKICIQKLANLNHLRFGIVTIENFINIIKNRAE